MRQIHKAGEKMFVDFAGQTVAVVDARTREIKEAQIFVAVQGASNYTYAEASWSQDLESWISCHTHAFSFFGGVTRITVPDNLGSGVTKACRYEPDLNPTYQDMAEYYGTVVIPARVAKPKDKAKVESGVQVVERWILARLRNRTFFSLAEVNAAIAELLEKLNNRPFSKLEGTRKSLFEKLDRPALLPLPSTPYEFAQFKKATVNIDYHIEVFGHYYSVPYQLVKERVEVRVTQSSVEVLFKGRRVTSHLRSYLKGGHSTKPEHMPKAHQKYLEWTPSRIIHWAGTIGPETARLVEAILAKKPHPEQGYRACLGLIRLSKAYSQERLEAASKRALEAGALSYQSVKRILKNNLDTRSSKEEQVLPIIDHDNIRGPDYYH
jgi:transposase